MEDLVQIRVSDLRQFAYCPRVVFYKYVMPVPFRETRKMVYGKQAEWTAALLEKRRTLRRYGLDAAERSFSRYFESRRLGLCGRLDLLLEDERRAWPVDVKDTRGGLRPNHILQLAAYGLLVEDSLGKSCRGGFVYILPEKRAVAVELGLKERTMALEAIEKVRELIVGQLCPSPTPYRARCRDCEYRNYCGDVF